MSKDVLIMLNVKCVNMSKKSCAMYYNIYYKKQFPVHTTV